MKINRVKLALMCVWGAASLSIDVQAKPGLFDALFKQRAHFSQCGSREIKQFSYGFAVGSEIEFEELQIDFEGYFPRQVHADLVFEDSSQYSSKSLVSQTWKHRSGLFLGKFPGRRESDVRRGIKYVLEQAKKEASQGRPYHVELRFGSHASFGDVYPISIWIADQNLYSKEA